MLFFDKDNDVNFASDINWGYHEKLFNSRRSGGNVATPFVSKGAADIGRSGTE
ncbi:hypothetical protein CE91St1_57770 [Parabacteroides goldsteinii]|nr:hypothetical protein CE91St1_57770 [Parabacteroides goldsteinii]GKG79958.1 hypothetical protein CE91St2_31500 [Parabacteroides goldsteinii]